MKIEITEATVLLSHGMDIIFLHTNLPCPFVKEFLPEQPPLNIKVEATYDTGVEYCRQVFGIEPKTVNGR